MKDEEEDVPVNAPGKPDLTLFAECSVDVPPTEGLIRLLIFRCNCAVVRWIDRQRLDVRPGHLNGSLTNVLALFADDKKL